LASQLRLPRFLANDAVGVKHLRWPTFLLGFSLAYFLAAKLGIATSLPPEGIVILWPPNAIVLAALLSVKRQRWWLLFLATVATEIAADVPAYPLWAAAGYGIVNFSEAALAAILLARFSEDALPLAGLRDFIRFVAIGPVLASGTAALLGAAIYKLGAPDLDYLHYWRVFWLGDALGLLTVGTVLLAWQRPAASSVRPSPAVAAEGAALSLGLLAVSAWALLADAEMPRVFLIFPFLAWAAIRFGVQGASIAIIAVAAIAIGSAVMGHGPFAGLSHIDAVVALQGLIAAVALSTFMLAFSTEASLRATVELQHSIDQHRETEAELRSAYRKLESINQKLDSIVAERTDHLRRALVRNEMLLEEVHHRVKNNLQLVSSLLAIHGRSVSAPEWRRKFGEVQGQIGAIAATYDVLQQMKNVDVVDFCHVVSTLCRSIQVAHGEAVSISTASDCAALVSADTAVALSLALNELITNSIKHGAGDQTVAIAVSCQREGESALIRIADDGAGFPPGFDLDHAEGFGMQMVRTMVNQAGGQIRLGGSQRGAVVEVFAPLAADRDQV
jgi:two-component sensor histidine kinase/integral membrane sensor domain MASE1